MVFHYLLYLHADKLRIPAVLYFVRWCASTLRLDNRTRSRPTTPNHHMNNIKLGELTLAWYIHNGTSNPSLYFYPPSEWLEISIFNAHLLLMMLPNDDYISSTQRGENWHTVSRNDPKRLYSLSCVIFNTFGVHNRVSQITWSWTKKMACMCLAHIEQNYAVCNGYIIGVNVISHRGGRLRYIASRSECLQ